MKNRHGFTLIEIFISIAIIGILAAIAIPKFNELCVKAKNKSVTKHSTASMDKYRLK